MTKTRVTFEKRVPAVLKIIREAEKPMGNTELYNRLKEETGVKISKTTFNKCLKYLLSTSEIVRTEEKGQGNPVTYSLNINYYIYKTEERVGFYARLLEHFADNYSPYGTEANLWSVLAREISGISVSLISALMYYSRRSDRYTAYEDYRKTIETEILPHMLAIHKLVKPPIQMHRPTVDILFTLFNESILSSMNKPLNPLMVLTPEQRLEISHLVSEKMGKSGTVFLDDFQKQ
jgi:hypothetical protein